MISERILGRFPFSEASSKVVESGVWEDSTYVTGVTVPSLQKLIRLIGQSLLSGLRFMTVLSRESANRQSNIRINSGRRITKILKNRTTFFIAVTIFVSLWARFCHYAQWPSTPRNARKIQHAICSYHCSSDNVISKYNCGSIFIIVFGLL